MTSGTWWRIAGIVAILAGVLAFWNPMAASLAVEQIAGWAFLIAGILQLLAVFQAPGTGNKVWLGLWGALATYLGFSLLMNPLQGVMTLTFVVAILLIASGLSRIIAAFKFGGASKGIIIVSGVISAALGSLILAEYPAWSESLLGIFLGIELIFFGISLFAMGKIIGGLSGLMGSAGNRP